MMRAIPDSRLVFATAPEGKPRSLIEEQFLTHGINGNRLSFHGMLSSMEFRQLLQKVDVTLDPVTVNGATSTCESLWLGVPVISLVGTRFLSRAGFSILSAAGMPEFALHSVSDCIGLARHIADDLSGLSRLRASMRDRISNSPLTNGALFAANIEQVYRTIWTKWCNRLA
jgi:predicted O-linked N-acetylglucosamine transferase (SPINDLY family)